MPRFLKALVFLTLCGLWPQSAASAAGGTGEYLGSSPELRSLPPSAEESRVPRMKPVLHPYPTPTGVNPAAPPLGQDSGAYVTPLTAATTTTAAPSLMLNFDGLGYGFPNYKFCCVPPDPNAAVGHTQVVEIVNTTLAVFDKVSGSRTLGPVNLTALFSSTRTNCGYGFVADPTVVYDKFTNHWVITFLAATNSFLGPISPFLQCFAISKTSDATGAWWTYSFDLTYVATTSAALNDYPKIGIWPTTSKYGGYYVTANEFTQSRTPSGVTTTLAGALLCGFDSKVMVIGGSLPRWACVLQPNEFSMLMADADSSTIPAGNPPPAFVGTLNGTNSFNLLRWGVDFSGSGAPPTTGPTRVSIATPAYSKACGGGACIPQPSTTQQLDSLGDRLMYRASYRYFPASGVESVLATHSVSTPSGATGIRVYEIRKISSGPAINRSITIAPADGLYRWMPSVAQDKNGNIALGYSVANGSISPSIKVASLRPCDTIPVEADVVVGGGFQSTYNRWGDYSSMSIDPDDDLTFWYTQEYKVAATSGTAYWSTRLASLKVLPLCP